MLSETRFYLTTQIIMGPHIIDRLPQEIHSFKCNRVLVTTDPGVRSAGIVDQVAGVLKVGSVEAVVFDQVEADPSIETAEKCAEILKAEQAGLIVAVGGGSAIDTGKAASILATNPGPLAQYEGVNKVPNPPLPVLAVPTTAGTASEVTFATVITDHRRTYKMPIRSSMLAPRIAFLDPILLGTVPFPVAATTGLDALTHAVEAYTSTQSSPMTDALAVHAIRFIGMNLRTFCANPQQVGPAMKMLVGSTMAGSAHSSARLGTAHALAHPLGAHFHVAHGLANAILLAPVMEFNSLAVPEKMADIAAALGEETSRVTKWDAAEKAVAAVRHLCADLNIPARVPEDITGGKVPSEAIDRMVKDALKSGLHLSNPRVTAAPDMEKLLKQVLWT